MKKTKNQNNLYNRFNMNNYDAIKPIKLLNNPFTKNSTSSDKINSKMQGNNSHFLYSHSKYRNSVDSKRPSTAPQKYKISKNKTGVVFGNNLKNIYHNNGLPNSYSNGFGAYNKRLPSPMISGQKFGMSQKLKFNSYRLSVTNNNFINMKNKKKNI